jgi:hypothetical protein
MGCVSLLVLGEMPYMIEDPDNYRICLLECKI